MRLLKNCTKKEDQDSRYRLLSNYSFSEEKIFSENGITNILNEYAPGKDGLYFVGPRVDMFMYGQSNFDWQHNNAEGVSKYEVHSMIMTYQTINTLLFWVIFTAIFQILLCGFLLNFLIMEPYCQAKRCFCWSHKTDKDKTASKKF